MNKPAKKSLVPKLRFPEFREAGEWQIRSLANIADFFKGKGLPKSAITNNGQMTCIHYGELFTEYTEIIQTIKSRTNLAENFFMSVENDVLMPTSDVTPNGLAKAACLKLSNIILGGDILVIRTNKEKINGEFLARYIRHQEQKVLQLVSGSTVFHLYASSIEKLTLSFPEKKEQQKIADCFSSLDDLISAQAQKIDALKTHKKGLMQQLFPAEGETVPKLRFPEFSWDWIPYKIGDFIESYCGGAALTPSDFSLTPDYEVIPKKAITEGGWLRIDSQNPTYCNEVFYKNNLQSVVDSTYLITTLRDLVPSGPSIGYIVKYKKNKKYLLAQGVYGFKTKQDIFSDFLIHFSNSNVYRKMMQSVMVGSTQVHIRTSIFFDIPIFIPTLKEQQKVADCLSSLDDLITAHTQKLDALKNLKKGLMQQLFPAIDEVSA
jgi:type I restriction enzyme S subunit